MASLIRPRGELLHLRSCQVHRGVKGIVYTTLEGEGTGEVREQEGTPLSEAVVVVTDTAGRAIEKNVTSSERGEFWRLLLPGEYILTAYRDICDTAGVIISSAPTKITIDSSQPLLIQNLNLNTIRPCSSGPR